ncbi:sensor histidine kinase [Gracilibacillus oryzae]|nr:histidine kinase [Gracilibacillus oryzae]
MIFKKFRDSKLMSKLMLTYILLTVIPISVLGYIAYSQYTKSIEDEVGKYIPQLLEQANNNIDNQINDFKNLPDAVYNSSQVIEILRKDAYQTKSTLLQDEFIVNSYLSRTYINNGNNDILGVFVLSKGRMFKSAKMNYKGFNKDSFPMIYGDDVDLQGRVEIILPSQTDITFENNVPFILFMRELRDYENQETLGAVFIAIQLSFLDEALKSLDKDHISSIWIADQNGKNVYHTNSDLIGESDENYSNYPNINGSFRTTQLAQNQLISRNELSATDWTLFHSVALQDLTKETDMVRNGTIIVFIIFVLLSTIISIFLAWNVSSPLNKLTRLMKRVEQGNFNVDLPINKNDEIGILANSFNSMIQKINQLIKKNYQIELRQKDAELYALQSQINPHFMYNTLETIGYAVDEEDKETVTKMVTLLGKMLRYSLNNKEKLVLISQELDHINDYLTIQKFRFEDRVDFHFDEQIDTSIFYMPKFVMQPIIENSIKYGLEKLEPTLISISIKKTNNDELHIRIEDNGPGIEKEVLTKLNHSLGQNPMAKRSSNFGLINVHARIAMIYGSAYGIRVESEKEKGTVVIIKIPASTNREIG